MMKRDRDKLLEIRRELEEFSKRYSLNYPEVSRAQELFIDALWTAIGEVSEMIKLLTKPIENQPNEERDEGENYI